MCIRTGTKHLALPLTLSMALSLTVTAAAAEECGVTILYTNDIHTYIDQDLTYSLVAAYKDSLENALLVDAGDHIQGTAYGGMDQGATIIQLMNAAGYDLATLGNHEFDYDMEGCMAAIQAADFPYVSCNFYHEADGVRGENVLDSYQVFEVGGVSVAIIGITTPESFTKSTPAYPVDRWLVCSTRRHHHRPVGYGQRQCASDFGGRLQPYRERRHSVTIRQQYVHLGQ